MITQSQSSLLIGGNNYNSTNMKIKNNRLFKFILIVAVTEFLASVIYILYDDKSFLLSFIFAIMIYYMSEKNRSKNVNLQVNSIWGVVLGVLLFFFILLLFMLIRFLSTDDSKSSDVLIKKSVSTAQSNTDANRILSSEAFAQREGHAVFILIKIG